MHNSTSQPNHLRVLAKCFSAFAPLSGTEIDLLRDLTEAVHYHPTCHDIQAAGAQPQSPRMIVAGWAAQYRQLADGQRQIISLRLPGDFVRPLMQVRLPTSYAVAALTELETVDVQQLAYTVADPTHPGLAYAIHILAHLDNVLLGDQIVRLGRQTAYERLAHLMLELCERLGRVGLVEHNCFVMPLTQAELADVLGLSVVHVNRTVQQLRRDDLLEVKNGVVTLMQPERLRNLAGWTPPVDFPIR